MYLLGLDVTPVCLTHMSWWFRIICAPKNFISNHRYTPPSPTDATHDVFMHQNGVYQHALCNYLSSGLTCTTLEHSLYCVIFRYLKLIWLLIRTSCNYLNVQKFLLAHDVILWVPSNVLDNPLWPPTFSGSKSHIIESILLVFINPKLSIRPTPHKYVSRWFNVKIYGNRSQPCHHSLNCK